MANGDLFYDVVEALVGASFCFARLMWQRKFCLLQNVYHPGRVLNLIAPWHVAMRFSKRSGRHPHSSLVVDSLIMSHSPGILVLWC